MAANFIAARANAPSACPLCARPTISSTGLTDDDLAAVVAARPRGINAAQVGTEATMSAA